jgi:hypothetical protein
MRERRKSKAKISGSGATVLQKWPYYDAMNFFENYDWKCSRDNNYN